MFIHLTLWLDELLINPLYVNALSMWGRHTMAPGSIYSWWGYEDMLDRIGIIWDMASSWDSFEMSWRRLSWVKTGLRRRETYRDKFQSIREPFVTSGSRWRQITTHLKRYETCYDISYSIGMSFMAFDRVWDDWRHLNWIWVGLSGVEARRWRLRE